MISVIFCYFCGMKAEIITIGDEILIGQVLNSNSAWIADALTGLGIMVGRIISIADNHEAIVQALEEATERADMVFLTGGLGPTRDDITKQTLVRYFNSKLVHSNEAFDRIKMFLTRRNVELNELNKAQAMLPDNCIIIPNRYGTASGMWFTKDDTEYLSLPGVPYEMQSMMSGYILPRLKKQYDLDVEWKPFELHPEIPKKGIRTEHLPIPRHVLEALRANVKKLAEEDGLTKLSFVFDLKNSRGDIFIGDKSMSSIYGWLIPPEHYHRSPSPPGRIRQGQKPVLNRVLLSAA